MSNVTVVHTGPTRTESDSMGQIEVPTDRYYGAQTARSLTHFAIGADTMPRAVIRAFGTLKKAAALVNKGLGLLPATEAELIVRDAAGRRNFRFAHPLGTVPREDVRNSGAPAAVNASLGLADGCAVTADGDAEP